MTSATVAAAMLLSLCALAIHAAHPADGRRQVHGGGGDLVVRTCRNATQRAYVPRLTQRYCVSALRSDKRSAAATHPPDLALVAMDLLQRSAAAAAAKLAGAVPKHDQMSKDTALTVHFCRSDYDAVARAVLECRPMIQEYRPGHRHGKLGFYHYLECADRLSEPALNCRLSIAFDDKVKEVAFSQVQEAVHRGNLVVGMI